MIILFFSNLRFTVLMCLFNTVLTVLLTFVLYPLYHLCEQNYVHNLHYHCLLSVINAPHVYVFTHHRTPLFNLLLYYFRLLKTWCTHLLWTLSYFPGPIRLTFCHARCILLLFQSKHLYICINILSRPARSDCSKPTVTL